MNFLNGNNYLMHILACGWRNQFPKCERSLVIPVNLYKYGLLWFACQ